MKTAVVAIGGNAILRAGQQATFDNQMANLKETCVHLAKLIKGGYDMVITHGNGPQVGNILLQNELLRDDVPPMPIDVCVAESQALIGYMIQQAMKEELEKLGMDKVVTCILTRVLVDPDDSAFDNPTKPVGPYYSEEEAREIGEERGWRFIEDLRRGGFRRVLPSPRPMDIIERSAIKRLVFGGVGQSEVVVAAGGGGIPVIRKKEGLKGVEAVVDKDLAACVLASAIDEKLLLLLTDVDRVYLNFGKKDQRPLDLVTAGEIEEYLAQGHFPPGSMGPKIEAAIKFLREGGVKVIITMPELLEEALEGRAGTQIVQGR
jgi:carbamate kinase